MPRTPPTRSRNARSPLGSSPTARTRWLLVALLVLIVGALVGALSYRHYREAQRAGVAVYKEFANDGMPVPQGVLNDPVFKGKTGERAAAGDYGRYKSPVQAASGQPWAQVFTRRISSDAKLRFLLIGTDQEALGPDQHDADDPAVEHPGLGRADVLLVVALDSRKREMQLLSIPRDTRVNIPGHGVQKINAAYAFGGASLQAQVVERFLGLPMDKIVEVSFGGFRQAIDAVGGVTVNPRFAFHLDDQRFVPGQIRLNGTSALAYSRMRKQDPQGDLGRNARQQEVLLSLMRALGGLPSDQLLDVMGRVEGDLRTDLTPSEVVKLRAERPYMLEKQVHFPVQAVNAKIGGLWYILISDAERRRLHGEMQ